MYPLDDTIAAISSPPGGAARGIVRLSGPQTRTVVEQYFRAAGPIEFSAIARPTAIAGALHLPDMASPLPCELYFWPHQRSYTGSVVAELHTLGSRPLLEAVLHALCAAGARLAGPGEFTLRAFLAGRIDLTQAEAVLGVIDAVNPDELDVALAQLAGGLAGPMRALRDTLLELLADLEAGFDFADEELPFITTEQLNRQLDDAAEKVAELARRMAARGETSGVIRAVLIGWPNTGKSSLFNALTRHTAALVSEQPATTRDYLTAELDLGHVKCQLIDTAGVDPQWDSSAVLIRSVQQAAQLTSARQHQRADVRVLCLDSTRPLNNWELAQLAGSPGVSPGTGKPQTRKPQTGGEQIIVWTKMDAARPTDLMPVTEGGLRTSSVTGEGLDALREELRRAVLTAGASGATVVAGTAARCCESLRLAAESLKRARRIARHGTGEELVAAELRVALEELGKVVGAVYTEDVLDRIFSRFCIGK